MPSHAGQPAGRHKRSHLIKHSLMLSAATAALLAAPAFADTTISTSTSGSSSALTTGTLETDAKGSGNAGNISITSAGALKIDTESVPVITVNSANYVYSNGLIQNNGVDDAYGIKVNFANGSYDLSSTGYAYTAADATTHHAAIYLDSSSKISLTGSGKSTKYGIWLDTTDATGSTGTLTGDIVLNGASNSSPVIDMEGSSSYGIYFYKGSTLAGDLTMAGKSTIDITGSSSDGIILGTSSTITGDFEVGSGSTIQMQGDSA